MSKSKPPKVTSLTHRPRIKLPDGSALIVTPPQPARPAFERAVRRARQKTFAQLLRDSRRQGRWITRLEGRLRRDEADAWARGTLEYAQVLLEISRAEIDSRHVSRRLSKLSR